MLMDANHNNNNNKTNKTMDEVRREVFSRVDILHIFAIILPFCVTRLQSAACCLFFSVFTLVISKSQHYTAFILHLQDKSVSLGDNTVYILLLRLSTV